MRLGVAYTLDAQEADTHNVFIIELDSERYAKMRILNETDQANGLEVTLLCYKAISDGYVFFLDYLGLHFMLKLPTEETTALANKKGAHSLLKDDSLLYFV